MKPNDCLIDLYGKNSNMILSDIDKIRSIGQSFNFTVSDHKKFTIALRNAEMSLRKNSAFLNLIFKTAHFYLFVVFKSFIETGNKLDTFEEYYTKFMPKIKSDASMYGLQFFKMYKRNFEELYKLAEFLNTAKTIVAAKI